MLPYSLLNSDFYLLNDMKPFLNDDFLLQTATAQQLYHEYAKAMPIIDYHAICRPTR